MVQLRLEEFIVVMDQTLYAKLHRLYRSTHTANVIGTFHITVNYSPQMGNGSKMLTCATYALYQETHCRGYTIRRIIWKNVQSISTILERWREYFQKLVDEENLRERKKWTASRSGG